MRWKTMCASTRSCTAVAYSLKASTSRSPGATGTCWGCAQRATASRFRMTAEWCSPPSTTPIPTLGRWRCGPRPTASPSSTQSRLRRWSKERTMALLHKVAAAALIAAAVPLTASAADNDWQAKVAEALGKTGAAMPGNVYRVGLPRTDIKATLDGVELKPGFALGGWLAFEKMTSAKAMVMGDLVLTEEEVNPVMAKLLEGGFEVTALHNHLLRNRPFTMYMHVLGQGDPVKLATLLHDALAESKTPLTTAPSGNAAPPP